MVPVRPERLQEGGMPRQRSGVQVLGLVQCHAFVVSGVESRVLRLRWRQPSSSSAVSAEPGRHAERDGPSLVPLCSGGRQEGRLPRQRSRLQVLGVVQCHTVILPAVESGVLRLRGRQPIAKPE